MAKKTVKGKGKRQLSQDQEFAIMKMVLDKFLWLGLVVMVFGFYNISKNSHISSWVSGVTYMVIGAVILGLFGMILVKEYEFLH
ncbi:MAG: hypothetical protein ACLFPQ_01205 [Candidatus Woesearchaeota archaeon]